MLSGHSFLTSSEIETLGPVVSVAYDRSERCCFFKLEKNVCERKGKKNIENLRLNMFLFSV